MFHLAIGLLFLLPTVAPFAWAGEVIDGIVATVNRQPLFQSDWEEAICFEAFMQQKPIAQVTQADRLKALQRLIDRQLLQAQMGNETFLQPSQEDIDKDVAKLRAQVANGDDDRSWQKLLANYGLTPDALKDHLRTQVRVMNFVDVRLRPNVHVQPEEIEAYYKSQLLPDLQKNGGKVVALDEVEPRIRELLVQQGMDEMLDVWLHNLRQQAEIHSAIPIPAETVPVEPNRASGAN
ncbi:MAG: SurA N-terminal domain-containing protein [Candidatus Korobacteraceae bacterium]